MNRKGKHHNYNNNNPLSLSRPIIVPFHSQSSVASPFVCINLLLLALFPLSSSGLIPQFSPCK